MNVPVALCASPPLACALVVPRTDPGPRCRVACGGEDARVRPEFGDDGHRDNAVDGTKPFLMSPCRSRSAIHLASFTSVFRPGTLSMCVALPVTSSKCSSSTPYTATTHQPAGHDRLLVHIEPTTSFNNCFHRLLRRVRARGDALLLG